MQKLSKKYDVKLLCQLLDLPRSSYYYVPQGSDDNTLRQAIEEICLRYIRYGYRRVTPVVKKKHKVGKDRVRLLMKDMDLQVRKGRRKVRTTQSDGTSRYPNLIKGLDISHPDHVRIMSRSCMVWRHHLYRLDEWLCGIPSHYTGHLHQDDPWVVVKA